MLYREGTVKLEKVILASHGTAGARAAEEAALALCVESGASLRHLFVVPDFWKGMMGDDWLNNAVTQARFGRYVESQLAREAADKMRRLAEAAEAVGVPCSDALHLDKPAPCLVAACQGAAYDLAVIGSPRPKGSPGLRSRMDLEILARALPTRLLIVPHPER
jgi:nucleotide-binding universal stress UspA family protein